VTRRQVTDRRDSLQLWIHEKASKEGRIRDDLISWGLGAGLSHLTLKNKPLTNLLNEPRTWTVSYGKRPEAELPKHKILYHHEIFTWIPISTITHHEILTWIPISTITHHEILTWIPMLTIILSWDTDVDSYVNNYTIMGYWCGFLYQPLHIARYWRGFLC
jgi:hypothetical protein